MKIVKVGNPNLDNPFDTFNEAEITAIRSIEDALAAKLPTWTIVANINGYVVCRPPHQMDPATRLQQLQSAGANGISVTFGGDWFLVKGVFGMPIWPTTETAV